MYTDMNFKTKKALKEAVAIFAPGLGAPKENGTDFVEGPWYPKPHTWYATVEMRGGIILKVK